MSNKSVRQSGNGHSSSTAPVSKRGLIGLLTPIATIVGLLAGIVVGLGQLLPQGVQRWFNDRVAGLSEKFLSDNCDLSGTWNCTGGVCKNPSDRHPSVYQEGDIMYFTNEVAGTSAKAGFFVRHRLILVPSWDPDVGGAFASVSNDCKTIKWQDTAVWIR
jgi:hypothetical protein